jgi:hypothetical protein
MTRRLLFLLCSTLFAVRTATAQDSLSRLGIDRETALQLTHIVDSVRARGLPTDPIIAKVRLGAQFRAAPQRIVAVARAVAGRLEEARTALAPAPTNAEIAAGADALSIPGVTADALRAVRSARRDEPVSVPLGVLTQLVAGGVPAKRATEIVTDLIKRGANNRQLADLQKDLDFDIGRGARATAAIDVRLRGLTAALAPSSGAAATSAGFQSGDAPKKQP